jgi:hypothetical protein
MFVPQIERQSLTSIPKTGKITVLYILIFIFLDSKLEGRRFCTKWHQAFSDSSLLLILAEHCSPHSLYISNSTAASTAGRHATACWFSNNVRVSNCYTACRPALPRHASCLPGFSEAILAVHLKENEADSSAADVAQFENVWHRRNLCPAVSPDGQVLSWMTPPGRQQLRWFKRKVWYSSV